MATGDPRERSWAGKPFIILSTFTGPPFYAHSPTVFLQESGISKAKKCLSEAGLRSFSTSSHPDQWYQKPKYPPPMDGESSSSFSFCEDQDLTTAPPPPPSLSTGQFFTPGACSEHGTDVDKQPSSAKQHRKKTPRLARVKTEIDKLSELQRDLSRRRSQVGELRVGLGFKREEEVEARVAFMKKLNTLFVPNGTQDAHLIAHEYEQLQSVTEEYLELERNYTVAEDELGMQEYELTLAMERLSGLLRRTSSAFGEEEGEAEDSDGENYSHGDELEDHEDAMLAPPMMQTPMPPSMVEYLTCMGDLEILHERVHELDTEWMELSEKQKSRTQFDLLMDDDSLGFLDSYEEHRKQTVADIEKTMLEANRLRAICQSQGLIPADQPQPSNLADDDDEDELALDGTDQEQLEEPLKTSAMQESPHPFFEPSSMSTTKFDRSQFINKWILHQLRHSTLQIAKLKSLPELRELAEVEGFDGVSISRLAMDLWFMDDAVMVEPPGSPPFTEEGDGDDGACSSTSSIEHGGAAHTLGLNRIRDPHGLQGSGRIKAKPKKDGNSLSAPRRKSEPVRRSIYWTVQNQEQNQILGRFRSVSVSCGIL